MLGADLVVAQGVCLVAGKLQGPLGEQRRAAQGRPDHPAPPPATSAGHPPGCLPDGPDAERLLTVAPDRVQVDPERPEQLGVAGPRPRHHPLVGQTSERGPGRRDLQPVGPQQLGGPALALDEGPEQDMLGAQVAVAEPLSFLPGHVQDLVGRLGEPAEHLAPTGFGAFHLAAPYRTSRARQPEARPAGPPPVRQG
jgi:hypothetical protein